jgi:hypothetical protein
MAIPAVNWDGTFEILALKEHVDWFVVMGYDYYWSGSFTAGPVTPLYALTSSYNYSLARTISSYQSEGIPNDWFILGIPYYGRQWKTQTNQVPSPILASGTAITYSTVRNNGSGPYAPPNYYWDHTSHSSCYIFFQNDSWNQCFIGLDRDARKWFDMVNYRDLAGIGIWALGYDDGYYELWQAISDKLTDCYIPLVNDTLFDSGGPTWFYYSGESYAMTIDHGYQDPRHLTFTSLGMETGDDSLWVYAGKDTLSPLLGAFTGNVVPGTFTSPSGAFTLKFRSGYTIQNQGWTAIFHDGSLMADEPGLNPSSSFIFPNPASHWMYIDLKELSSPVLVRIIDQQGRVVKQEETHPQLNDHYEIDVNYLNAGIYQVILFMQDGTHMSNSLLIY